MSNLKIFMYFLIASLILTAIGYLIGPGPVIIIIIQGLMLAAQRYWVKMLHKNILKSHEVLGKNQKAILSKISSLEEGRRR